jgi:hypothetical protein
VSQVDHFQGVPDPIIQFFSGETLVHRPEGYVLFEPITKELIVRILEQESHFKASLL